MHFLICWKCQHPRSEASAQVGQAESEPPTEEPVEAELAQPRLICPKCSSDDLVPNASISVIAGGKLRVILEPDKNDAKIPGLLSANVCERCGYVELRAKNL